MIPRIAHFIAIGPMGLPEYGQRNIAAFGRLHPEWEVRVHREPILLPAWTDGMTLAMKADIMRLMLLYRDGGVYLDLDCEPRKSLDALLDPWAKSKSLTEYGSPNRCFVGWVNEKGTKINNAVIGATAGHPDVKALIDSIPLWIVEQAALGVKPGNAARLTGPAPMTALWKSWASVVKFPRFFFYPYHTTERWKEHDEFPESFVVHRWANSWIGDLSTEERLSYVTKQHRKALAEISRLRAMLAHTRNDMRGALRKAHGETEDHHALCS